MAVFQGKAELEMCLPHTYDQARSMSNLVMDETPNGIFVLREDMVISEFNRKSEMIFGVSKSEAVGRYIFEYMESDVFEGVLADHIPIHRKKWI